MIERTKGFEQQRTAAQNGSSGVPASLVIVALGAAATYFTQLSFLALIWAVPMLFLASRRHRGIVVATIFQLGIPSLVSVLAYVLYDLSHHYVQYAIATNRLTDDAVQISAFIQIVSTLYAICIAFTLWKATNDYDLLKTFLRDEASKVASIISLMRYFENVDEKDTIESMEKIKDYLAQYVSMARRGDVGDIGGLDGINECVYLVEKLSSPQENDKVALEKVISGLSELVMIRSRRISLSSNRIPKFLIFILGALSVASISLFFVFDSRELNVSHFVIPVLAFMYAFLMVMLFDLDNPFEGYWSVKTKAFEEVSKVVDEFLKARTTTSSG
ncbi:DUF4239 domain-containing protein [Stappia sp. P2PMeth1]|uniref:bestrophin-like domain n=1 Tax=Stappia sp. P2PMeth1 TaxID=2003586 RepID=UPI0016476CBA|nr:DUF4239 domain-containing protein [Stappia sp. P2PMeth1]